MFNSHYEPGLLSIRNVGGPDIFFTTYFANAYRNQEDCKQMHGNDRLLGAAGGLWTETGAVAGKSV